MRLRQNTECKDKSWSKSMLLIFGLIWLVSFTVYGQEHPRIPKLVQAYESNEIPFIKYNIFKVDSSIVYRGIDPIIENAVIFEVDSNQLRTLFRDVPKTIEISVPYNEDVLQVQLFQKDILTEDFKVRNERLEIMEYKPGLYYRGVVSNYPNSLASFSIFENRVYGIISIPGSKGNINVGQLEDQAYYIAYQDVNLAEAIPMHCSVILSEEDNLESPIIENKNQNPLRGQTENCVKIYYEIAYKHFVSSKSDISKTVDWMTAIHNNVSTLYDNDGIKIALNEIMVWTVEDPYTDKDNLINLRNFVKNRSNFNGDLANLINAPQATSYAYLDVLCRNIGVGPYACSGINYSYKNYPVYTFTVNVIAHEMGHVLGSNHTHDCVWNGDNTAIDGCGPSKGYKSSVGSCPDVEIPMDSGGTIMSYCHLVSGTGINFTNGFGPQPAAKIRERVDSKWCLGTDCILSCQNSLEDLDVLEVSETTAKIRFNDNHGEAWEIAVFPVNGGGTGYVYVSDSIYTLSGLKPNTYYYVDARNVCKDNYFYYRKRTLFLTDGASCEEDMFRGFGDNRMNLNPELNFTKTFYDRNRDSLEIQFQKFNAQNDAFVMNVYDGENIEADLFPNGIELTGDLSNDLPVFRSTNEYGAITLEFNFKTIFTFPEWEASIICSGKNTGVNDLYEESTIRIWPNPTKDMLRLDSKEDILKVEIRNLTGNTAIKELVDCNNHTIDISHLSSGIWFMTVYQSSLIQSFKVIKL